MHRTSTPPIGNTGRSGSRPAATTSGSSRGGIQKRRSNLPRVDKDGDLSMDTGSSTRGNGRGSRARGRGGSLGHNDSKGNSKPNSGIAPPQRGLFSGAALQKAIARGMASGDMSLKGPNRAWKTETLVKETSGRQNFQDGFGSLDQITVLGLKQSKAASNKDGGVNDLLAFLERKASGNDTSAQNKVLIRKVCYSIRLGVGENTTQLRHC